MTAPVAHEKFYFDNIVIQVEMTLFKVPRSFLLGSPVFEGMFALPQNDQSDGRDDEHPLRLEGVKLEEFILFFRMVMAQFAGSVPRMTFSEMYTVLRLLDMWSFDELRGSTLSHLEALFTPANSAWQYRLGKDHGMVQWIVPAVTQLLTRQETLSEDDVAVLGPAATARILRLREDNLIWYCLARTLDNGYSLDARFSAQLESFK